MIPLELNAEIVNFGIVDSSDANDIHIWSRFESYFFTFLTWKCLT